MVSRVLRGAQESVRSGSPAVAEAAASTGSGTCFGRTQREPELEGDEQELLHRAQGDGLRAGQLDHLATDLQGANGFATPRSAGSSSGKWRRSTVFMVVSFTQSKPSRV
jgi:hypothetical protein